MTTVDLISLNKKYPNQEDSVLRDFSLLINSGELVALLGPSGSGKSTVLKLITGIEKPDSGDIQLDGSSILKVAPNQRGAVLMFQKSYLFPFLNIEDNIAFGLKMRGDSKESMQIKVRQMLDLINLPGIENRKASQLSGGEQQRVALARALITEPKLLLLDEPLTSLDSEVRFSLQIAIRNIQQELGITTIFVTHDLNEAMAVSDRMALLLNGEIVAIDTPEEMFHHPSSEAAARFMGITTFLNGEQAGALKAASTSSKKILAIRPEHIQIQKESAEHSLAGVVINRVFRGEYVEYEVATTEQTILAKMAMPSPVFSQGEQVFVIFPSEHLFEVA